MQSSEESLPDVNVQKNSREERHCVLTHRADQWEQKARAHAGSDVSDWQDVPCGHALPVCLVRQRQVSLRHADWQIAETLRGEEGTKKTKLDCLQKS